MKHLKMLGLAVVASAALIAVIGAGSASATELCSTATTACSGTKYGKGTKLVAGNTGNVVLITRVTTITCTASTIEAETTSAGGAGTTAVTGKTTALTFTGCTRTGGEKCAVKSTNLGTVSLTGGAASTTAGFNYNVTSKTGANVTCGFFINCTFFTEETTLTGTNQASGKPVVKAEEEELAEEGGLCPLEVFNTWTATYEITSPTPLFVV
jgi:hypothetical protein